MAKSKRECSFCHQAGHNQRTCRKKREADAESEAGTASSPVLAEAVPVAASSSRALVPARAKTPPKTAPVEVPAPNNELAVVDANSPSTALHLPIEFEGADKQVHHNGTTLRLTYREYEAGVTNITLRFQRETAGAKDIQLDIEVAAKLYELLAWVLQRHQVTRARVTEAKSAKSNGFKQAEAR